MFLYFGIQSVFYYFPKCIRKNFYDSIHDFLLEPNQVVEIYETILVCQGLSYFIYKCLWKAQSIYLVEEDWHYNPEQVHNNVSDTWLIVFNEEFEFIVFCLYLRDSILCKIKVPHIYWLQTLCKNYGHITS